MSVEKSGQTGRIIIQLSELCGAELTRTGADFLLPILPSATSPCRGSAHPISQKEEKRNTHSKKITNSKEIGFAERSDNGVHINITENN